MLSLLTGQYHTLLTVGPLLRQSECRLTASVSDRQTAGSRWLVEVVADGRGHLFFILRM